MISRTRAIALLCCLGTVAVFAADTPVTSLLVLDKTDNSLVIVDATTLMPVGCADGEGGVA